MTETKNASMNSDSFLSVPEHDNIKYRPLLDPLSVYVPLNSLTEKTIKSIISTSLDPSSAKPTHSKRTLLAFLLATHRKVSHIEQNQNSHSTSDLKLAQRVAEIRKWLVRTDNKGNVVDLDWKMIEETYEKMCLQPADTNIEYYNVAYHPYYELIVSGVHRDIVQSREYMAEYRSHGWEPHELKVYWDAAQLENLCPKNDEDMEATVKPESKLEKHSKEELKDKVVNGNSVESTSDDQSTSEVKNKETAHKHCIDKIPSIDSEKQDNQETSDIVAISPAKLDDQSISNAATATIDQQGTVKPSKPSTEPIVKNEETLVDSVVTTISSNENLKKNSENDVKSKAEAETQVKVDGAVNHKQNESTDDLKELTYDPSDFDAFQALREYPVQKRNHAVKFSYINKGIEKAVFDVPANAQIILLNFANERSPGGGYLWHARAQEEVLLFNSDGYRALLDLKYGRMGEGYAIPEFGLAYVRDIRIFEKETKRHRKADMLVSACYCLCGSPQLFENPRNFDEWLENNIAKFEAFIAAAVANTQGDGSNTYLLLGPIGTGAFGNDVNAIGKVFHKVLRSKMMGSTGPIAKAFGNIWFVSIDKWKNDAFEKILAEFN